MLSEIIIVGLCKYLCFGPVPTMLIRVNILLDVFFNVNNLYLCTLASGKNLKNSLGDKAKHLCVRAQYAAFKPWCMHRR